jgi:spore cortex biosynthesis protein YabQ
MSLSTQFITMLTMISSGFYIGVIQDTFRRFTPYWKNRRIMTYVMEIGFWLTQTLLLFYILFLVNGGEIRLYIILACLLGFSTYQAVAATSYKKLLEHIIRMVSAVYRFFVKVVQAVIISPIKGIIFILYKIIMWLIKLILKLILFVIIAIITPIKWLLLFIFRLLPKKVQGFILKLAGIYSTMKNKCIKIWKYVSLKRR